MAVNLTAIFKVKDQGTAMLRKLTHSMDKVNQTSRTASEGLSKTQASVSQLGTTATSTSSKIGDLKNTLAGLGVGVGLGALAKSVVGIGVEFDTVMSKVKAVSGASDADFQRLKATARDLAKTTKYSLTEAGQGMEYLALAGWKTDAIIAAMPGMLALAAAGAMDLGKAADITSDTMQAFSMSADKAGHAADVFAYAQANANTNVEQLGDAMTYLAPIANTMGWKLEESAAAMMAVADAGIKGSMGGQAFASSLSRLAKPTDAMLTEMDRLNISLFTSKGELKSMPDLIGTLEGALKGATKKQKANTLATLFGQEAFKHWAVLLERGSGNLRTLTTNLEKADGAALAMADTMMNNLGGDWELLKSGLAEAAYAVYEQFEPAMRSVVQYLTGLAEKLPTVTNALVNMVKPFAFLKPIIAPIAKALFVFLGVLVSIVAISGAISALGMAFSLLLSPIGLIAAGITAVGLAFATAYKKSEKFRNAINAIGSAFKAVSTIFSQGLKGYGTARNLLEEAGFSENQIQLIIKYSYSLKDAFDKIKSAIEAVSEIFKNGLKGYGDTRNLLESAGLSEEQIRLVISFSYRLKDAFDRVKSVFDGIGTLITGGSSKDLLTALGLSPKIASKIDGVIDGIKSKISELMNAFNKGGVGGVFDKIFGDGSFDSIKSKFEEVKSYIAEKITQFEPVFERLKEAFSIAWTTIGDIISNAWSIIEPYISGLWNMLQILGDVVMSVYSNVIAPAISFVVQLFSTLWTIAKPILEGLALGFEKLSSVIKWVWDNVLAPLVDFILTGVKNAFDTFSGVLSTVQGWFETLTGWISTAYGHIKDFVSYLANVKPPDWLTSGISAGVSFVGNIFGGGGKGGKKSHYSGLDSVPYDGYSARLHKGERVLTARENKEYSEGKGGNGASGGVVITGNSFTVREEADIEKVAYQLAKLIEKEANFVG